MKWTFSRVVKCLWVGSIAIASLTLVVYVLVTGAEIPASRGGIMTGNQWLAVFGLFGVACVVAVIEELMRKK